MSEHAPGPWGFAPIDPELTQGYRYAINQNGGGWWIAKVSGGKHFAAAEANARLIAAAPDLLAALIEAKGNLQWATGGWGYAADDLVVARQTMQGYLKDIEVAIAKATGGDA